MKLKKPRTTALTLVMAMFGTAAALAQDRPGAADDIGAAVSVEAQLLKDAEDISFSAEDLRPISLDSIPAEIDLNSLPGTAVSNTARSLRDLDPADIPATARTLGDAARGNLPASAGSAAGRTRSPSLPAAAGRSRGRGRN